MYHDEDLVLDMRLNILNQYVDKFVIIESRFDHQGNKKVIDIPSGGSLMEAADGEGVPGILADCGGAMACATCHVYVDDNWYGTPSI